MLPKSKQKFEWKARRLWLEIMKYGLTEHRYKRLVNLFNTPTKKQTFMGPDEHNLRDAKRYYENNFKK